MQAPNSGFLISICRCVYFQHCIVTTACYATWVFTISPLFKYFCFQYYQWLQWYSSILKVRAAIPQHTVYAYDCARSICAAQLGYPHLLSLLYIEWKKNAYVHKNIIKLLSLQFWKLNLYISKHNIEVYTSSFADRAFACAGPRAWNNLPPELRRTKTLDTFKKHLKTFLFKQAYGWWTSYFIITILYHTLNVKSPLWQLPCIRRSTNCPLELNWIEYTIFWHKLLSIIMYYIVESSESCTVFTFYNRITGYGRCFERSAFHIHL